MNSMQEDEFFEVKNKLYELVDLQVVPNDIFPSASVKIKKGAEVFKSISGGNGSIDALYIVIKNMVKMDINLKKYKISSISRGKEALEKITIQVSFNGENYTSKATDIDVIKASALALINVVNNIIIDGVNKKVD